MTRQERRRLDRDEPDFAMQIIAGEGEIAIRFADVEDTLFVSRVEGRLVVEAVVVVDDSMTREVRRRRHLELMRRSRIIFASADFEHYDPRGYCGGVESRPS